MYKINYNAVQCFAEDLLHLNQDTNGDNEVTISITSNGIWIQTIDSINNCHYPCLFIAKEEDDEKKD